MRLIRVLLLSLLCIPCAGPLVRSWAEEFRIETDIFIDQSKEPAIETLTIFSGGVVYDFLLTGVEEITIFDRDRNRLVLLDTQRKVKTELTLDGILAYIAQMKAHLAEGHQEFLLGEEMTAVTDDEGWLSMSNGHVTYRAEGITPKARNATAEYQQFADWYARLNAMRQGNSPPFVRIRLNSELSTRGLIPKTIERTIVQKRGIPDKKQTLRSQHLANWRLSQSDRKQIDRAGTFLADFPEVSFREYVQLPEKSVDDEVTRR
ncbi:MAG: hypothetical protein ACYC0X_24725 [Pirellulaceae bacterium]